MRMSLANILPAMGGLYLYGVIALLLGICLSNNFLSCPVGFSQVMDEETYRYEEWREPYKSETRNNTPCRPSVFTHNQFSDGIVIKGSQARDPISRPRNGAKPPQYSLLTTILQSRAHDRSLEKSGLRGP